jgi:hypothetical protein
MNDSVPTKRRRAKRKEPDTDVQIHARVDKLLLDAVQRPNCSISYTINRALKACLEKEQPNNLKALAIRIRSLKLDAARVTRELSEAREQAKALGVKDIGKFEDSLEAWE